MKNYYLLYLCAFSNFLFTEGPGFFSRSGVGLYIDASYSPVWRSPYENDNIIRDTDDLWYPILTSGTDVASSSVVNSSGSTTTGEWTTTGVVNTNGFNTIGYWGGTIFSMKDIPSPFTGGLRVNANFSANRETAAEATFLGLYDFNYRNRFTSSTDELGVSISPFIYNELGQNIQKANFEGLSVVGLDHKESFNSIELNAMNYSSPKYYDYFCVAMYKGIRAMEYKNSLDLDCVSEEIEGFAPPVYNDVIVKNRNRFIGAQIGFLGMYRYSQRIYLSVPIKGGIFADIIQSNVKVNYREVVDGQTPPTTLETLADITRNEIGFGVCAETTPRIELHLGQMYFYLGGTFLYLFGTSPAAKQITDSTTGTFFTSGAEIGSTGIFQKYFFANLPNNMLNKPADSGYFYLTGINIGGGLHF